MFHSQFNPVWVSVVLAIAMSSWAAADHQQPITDGPDDHAHQHNELDPNRRADPEAPLIRLDSLTPDSIVSPGPNARVIKNLTPTARGIRRSLDATTDVWAHGRFAYTGTFESPCGGEPEAGIWVWDTHNVQKDQDFPVTIIPSPEGSRSNDVKVATMNSGDILVHSNEVCGAGGIGGFEIYSVDDPENPLHLASVQTDDVNALLRDTLGFVDFGVHNLFLFTQGEKDYVAAVVESEFGNFQIFDITDPTNPELVGFWGAEQLHRPDVADWVNLTDFSIILDADAFLFDGFGASQNRFLHDITITADGQQAYLASWDAGLVLLDISDPAEPEVVSVAIDPVNGSLDGEVNSHSSWPSEDGSIVVEGEEDFAPFETTFEITTGPDAGVHPAVEGSITEPIANLPGMTMSGPTTYVGLACDATLVPAGSGIALIQRGACMFSDKIANAESAGYEGVVVFNHSTGGDALVVMGGEPVNRPGVFVGHSTGLTIAGVASEADLVIGESGEAVRVEAVPNAWGGLRIWDYSDQANPVLAATFNTVCSAEVIGPNCLEGGTYSAHNIIVESTGEAVKAYVSWYWDGTVVLDVTDPYNPVEVARFSDQSTEFQFENGGPQDFWGVDKIPNEPWIYGSDRNGGLYILKELGQGTLRAGK